MNDPLSIRPRVATVPPTQKNVWDQVMSSQGGQYGADLATNAAMSLFNGGGFKNTVKGVGFSALSAAAPIFIHGALATGTLTGGATALGGFLGIGGAAAGAGAAGAGAAATTAGVVVPGATVVGGGSMLATMGALATNPVTIIAAAGLAAFFIGKWLWGRGLAKAKSNFTSNGQALYSKLQAQGVPSPYAENIASQQSFESLSPKDRKKLLKQARKKPQGEAAQIVASAGYNPATGAKVINFAKQYFKETGKVVGDMDISQDFKSSANPAEQKLAATQLALINKSGTGKITRDELVAYFKDNKLDTLTSDQTAAFLKDRGFAIDTKQLQDGSGKITAETFANYVFAEVDQKSIFKSNPADGSLTASSDGTISGQEFADLFIQPKNSDWQGIDGQSNLNDLFKDFKTTNSSDYDKLFTQSTTTPSTIGKLLTNYSSTPLQSFETLVNNQTTTKA